MLKTNNLEHPQFDHGTAPHDPVEHYVMPKDGQLTLAIPKVEAESPAEVACNNDFTVRGDQIATIRLGGAQTYVDAIVYDLSRFATEHAPEGPGVMYAAGTFGDDKRPFHVPTRQVIVIPSIDGQQARVLPLYPDSAQAIGRGVDQLQDILPDTVSRNHCSVTATESALVIRNNNPTNDTIINPGQPTKTEIAASPETTLSHTGAIDLLSYPDVADGNLEARRDWTEHSESGVAYARELEELAQQYGMDKIVSHVEKMKAFYQDRMAAIGLTSSVWGESDSWIFWDLAKQYHLNKHPEKSRAAYQDHQKAYGLGDPFDTESSRRKAADIIARHMGWEFNEAVQAGDPTALSLLRQNQEAARILARGERNEHGLSSHELSRLGRELFGQGKWYPPTPLPMFEVDET